MFCFLKSLFRSFRFFTGFFFCFCKAQPLCFCLHRCIIGMSQVNNLRMSGIMAKRLIHNILQMLSQRIPVCFCFSLCFCGSFCSGSLFCLRFLQLSSRPFSCGMNGCRTFTFATSSSTTTARATPVWITIQKSNDYLPLIIIRNTIFIVRYSCFHYKILFDIKNK
ncbi:Uncharacterised protein [Shigella sonnei]|nr:Uncharacterised protein [Shigella sonnei]